MPDFFIEGLAEQVLGGSDYRYFAPELPEDVRRAAEPFVNGSLLDAATVSEIRKSFGSDPQLPHVCLGNPLRAEVADEVHAALEKASFAPHHHDSYKIQIARREKQVASRFSELVDWLASKEGAAYHSWLVGSRVPVDFIQVQTSRAVAGDHFPAHVDTGTGGLAVIYNLTRDWEPSYGGVLRYLDESDQAYVQVPPSFHQVFICEPAHARHEVSRIEKAAGKRRRYSLTAFYLDEAGGDLPLRTLSPSRAPPAAKAARAPKKRR